MSSVETWLRLHDNNKTTEQIEAYERFNALCIEASECRHELYQVSCNSCDKLSECEIQIELELKLEESK